MSGHAEPSEEDDLLRAARAGGPNDLGRLFERYREYLTVLARIQIGRRLQGKVDAGDIVQEVFLDAHRQFLNFRGETAGTLVAWLRQILAGRLAALVRRYCHALSRDVDLERSLQQEMESSSDLIGNGLRAPGNSPSESAARREETVILARALERLPTDYRETIILRQIEGLPFAEVARRMGRSEDSIQKLWVRGLDALRKLIEVGP